MIFSICIPNACWNYFFEVQITITISSQHVLPAVIPMKENTNKGVKPAL